jgi:uncharacterized protein (TIGR00251 family)
MTHAQWHGDTLILYCHLQANAATSAFAGLYSNRLKIRIDTPPVDGKANQRLITFLSHAFGVPKTAVNIQKGLSSRQKTVAIQSPKTLPIDAMLAAKRAHP